MRMSLDHVPTQAEAGAVLGISQPRVSELERVGLWHRSSPLAEIIRCYCEHLREVAAGRGSAEAGGLDLVQERAALARSQRLGQDIKNGVAQRTYAPISLLAQTLALASQAVAERFEQLPSLLKKACPELPENARAQVMAVLAGARNEWIDGTMQLLTERFAGALAEDESADGGPEAEPGP